MFFLFLSRFFKGTSTAGACSSLIHKYDSLFARLSYFYFLDSLSRLLLSSLLFAARAPNFFFNVQVLFLPSHTLINEFFLFPSFPARRTFPASLYLAITTIPSKVPPLLSPRSFSQAIANSHDNPPFSRRVPTSRILPILFEAASSFRSAGDLFRS